MCRSYRGTFTGKQVRIPKPEGLPEQQVLRRNIDFSRLNQDQITAVNTGPSRAVLAVILALLAFTDASPRVSLLR